MECQALRHDLERQLRERDEDMEAQRREITFGFDEVRHLTKEGSRDIAQVPSH